MSPELRQLLAELRSDDEATRDWAAVEAGNYGVEAVELLPELLDAMDQKLQDLPLRHWGEFVSVGRIVNSIQTLINRGNGSDELRTQCDQAVERVLMLLKNAHGAAASLLIRILVLAGPRMADHAPLVLAATLRDADPRSRYRAYQFAYAVAPTLLTMEPWSTFCPYDHDERAEWERAAFDA